MYINNIDNFLKYKKFNNNELLLFDGKKIFIRYRYSWRY